MAFAGAGAGVFKVNTIWVLLAAGLVGLVAGRRGLSRGEGAPGSTHAQRSGSGGDGQAAAGLTPMAAPMGGAATAGAASLAGVALVFFKTGLVFFGGGFVLIPILHQRLVEHLPWLTPREFLDGVAISNLTPDPIAVLATFAGYRLQGLPALSRPRRHCSRRPWS